MRALAELSFEADSLCGDLPSDLDGCRGLILRQAQDDGLFHSRFTETSGDGGRAELILRQTPSTSLRARPTASAGDKDDGLWGEGLMERSGGGGRPELIPGTRSICHGLR
jgi:hypothetical protein